MTPNGAAMRNKIREATAGYIEKEAPAEHYTRRICILAKDRAIRINEHEIETESGQVYAADVIIYATGFLTQRWLFPMEVRGIDGKDLQAAWDLAGGAEAYKGTVVTDFPNFFILYGLNAATGQHSVIFHSECQVNYSCRLLRPVLKQKTIMVKPEAQKRDLTWVHGKLQGLVFNSGCQSWWMDPVTKKNTFIYPDPMFKYWLRTIFPIWSDFDIAQDGRQVKMSASSRIISMLLLTLVGAAAMLVMNLKVEHLASGSISNVFVPTRRSLITWN
ncbi:hypothetical protein H2199_005388 [Coniosporium tulheliwenetii]|uniref:Uncharacterized protein n=1 Tax=Coniosporium tulheliwenetii TaxID=3383036 RepID=A0ACC2Z140_9PEZI|nr:hypothetical protein H2199_005388 [Cladosporium sp. JES 115]